MKQLHKGHEENRDQESYLLCKQKKRTRQQTIRSNSQTDTEQIRTVALFGQIIYLETSVADCLCRVVLICKDFNGV